jgi:TLC ATP/ADP transporter
MRQNKIARLLFLLAFGLIVAASSPTNARVQDLLPAKILGQLPTLMHQRKAEIIASGAAANSGLIMANSPGQTKSALVKFRNTIFPIYGKEEVKKFLLLGSIKFFIILALTLTRDTKDTLVVTQCGAEAIAFLKVRSVTIDIAKPMPQYFL